MFHLLSFSAIGGAELEEEIADFTDGYTVRNHILDFIQERIELNETFPLAGAMMRRCSVQRSCDGTKVGPLGEADAIYILDKDKVSIFPGENGEVNIENFHVKWKGVEYCPIELFAISIDLALQAEPPEGMEHNGYAALRYCGIRVGGPGVTVLFQTATDIGSMKKGSMVSVGIMLIMLGSHLQSKPQAAI